MSVEVSINELNEDPKWREIFDYARAVSKKNSKNEDLEISNYFFLLKDFFQEYGALYDSNVYYKDEVVYFINEDRATVEKEVMQTWKETMQKILNRYKWTY